MNDVYLWSVASVTTLVALNTVFRLWTERDRLSKEDLSDEDRAFVWRIVLFIIFPLLTLCELRATTVVCEMFGGFIKSWTYGLLWYQAVPAGLSSAKLIIPVLFAGEIVTTLLALCLIPALLFRPHPFLATLIGYTAAFILGLNFIADPILSFAGLGGLRWQLALMQGPPEQIVPLVAVHAVLALLFIAFIRNSHVRFWFSDLTRPNTSEELKEALAHLNSSPETAQMMCKVGLLYDRAGMRRQAKRQLRNIKDRFPDQVLFANFLQSLVSYRRRDYKKARHSFVHTSDFPGVDGELKASLLAAGACAAFADNDIIGALNLCERALEFDDACLVARMVKVDVFLRQGKKEQAGDEILTAMHMGLTMDLENKVPLDADKAFESLVCIEERRGSRILQSTSRF